MLFWLEKGIKGKESLQARKHEKQLHSNLRVSENINMAETQQQQKTQAILYEYRSETIKWN